MIILPRGNFTQILGKSCKSKIVLAFGHLERLYRQGGAFSDVTLAHAGCVQISQLACMQCPLQAARCKVWQQ